MHISHTCAYAYICAHAHPHSLCICTCMYTHIHTHSTHAPPHKPHRLVCTCHTHIHTHTYTHIHVLSDARTHTLRHTLAPVHGPPPWGLLAPLGAHPQTTRPGHRQDPCATSHRLGRSLCSGQSQICRRRNQQVHPGLLCQARPAPPHTHKQGSPATLLPADLPATHAACGSQRRAAVAEARVHPEHNRHSLLSAARPRTGASAGEWPPVRGQHSPACSGDPPPLEHQAPAI